VKPPWGCGPSGDERKTVNLAVRVRLRYAHFRPTVLEAVSRPSDWAQWTVIRLGQQSARLPMSSDHHSIPGGPVISNLGD
jgi:hypothetical protein